MSDYSKSYDGASKDAAEDPISGAEFDTEFSAIESAIATKVNEATVSTGNLLQSANGGDTLADSGETVASLKTYARQPDYHEDTNANKVVDYLSTASAVNYLTVDNASASNPPEISVDGTDTNIDLLLSGKGSGVVKAAIFTVTSALNIPAGSIDSAEIAASAVDTSELAANSVTSAKIAPDAVKFADQVATVPDTYQQSVSAGGTYTIPEGIYIVDAAISNAGHYIQLKNYAGSWVTMDTATLNLPKIVVGDGSNVRWYNSSGSTHTVRWRRMY